MDLMKSQRVDRDRVMKINAVEFENFQLWLKHKAL